MRRFVLAPLLTLASATLLVLVAISLRAAVVTDLTALAYAVLLLAAAATAWTAGRALWHGRFPPLPDARPHRTVAALTAPAIAAGAVAAMVLALLLLTVFGVRPDPSVPDGDPCCTHPDTWADVATGAGLGFALLLGGFGLGLAAVRTMGYALRGDPGRPRALEQSFLGWGAFVLAAFPAWIVIEGVLRGDYP